MNYIISQIIGVIAFIISLTTYHKKEKNNILTTAIISNLVFITSILIALIKERKLKEENYE